MENVENKDICPWCGKFLGTNWGPVSSGFFPPDVYIIIKHYECGHFIKQKFHTEWEESVALTNEEAATEKLNKEFSRDSVDGDFEEEFSEEEIELADAELS